MDDSIAHFWEALDAEEAALLLDVDTAKWRAAGTVLNEKGFTAAALLDTEGARERVPGYSQLVERVAPSTGGGTIVALSRVFVAGRYSLRQPATE